VTDHPLDIGPIETARLTLRRLRSGEAEALRAVTADPAVTAVIPFLPEPFGLQQAQALLARQADGRDLYLGLWRRADGDLLGALGVHLRGAAELELGYWLPARHHGRGYASEAARAAAEAYGAACPERRLIAECRPDNPASRRVLEKAGFRPTGTAGSRAGRDLFARGPVGGAPTGCAS
jgi:RimJ/RimL family protein N-acetyltransferase